MTTNLICDNIKISTKKGDKIVKTQILIVILAAAVCSDMISWKIKNSIILVGLATGAVYMVLEQTYLSCILGVLLPVIFLWPLFSIRAFGAGDIKLVSVVGMFQGVAWLPTFLVKALFIGALLSIIQIIRERNLKSRFLYLSNYFTTIYITKTVPHYYDSAVDGKAMVVHFSIAILTAYIWEIVSL